MKNILKNKFFLLIIALGAVEVFMFIPQAWSTVMAPPELNQIIPETRMPSNAFFLGSLFTFIMSLFRSAYIGVKRIIDIVGSIVALILSIPIFAIVSVLIKAISKGPVFYTQVRVGRNGQLFNIYKFRSMRTDAETKTGPVWASKNDDRLIPIIGKFIRKSRIDEIPQFVNVLKGEMSIIGPRPERPVFVEKFKNEINGYERRLQVKPGITGLSQVWHHYDESIMDVRKKVKYDCLYIKKMCLTTDLAILVRTFSVVLTGSGAK